MRPRERYLDAGPQAFSDAELLALVIGTGTPQASADQIAGTVLSRFGTLERLAETPVAALEQVSGIGRARAIRLHAALQAGLRAGRRAGSPATRVLSPEDAWTVFRPRMDGLTVEEFHALYLDRRGSLLWVERVTRGTDQQTLVDPRQVYRPAVQLGASGVVVAHNHVSGDPLPSRDDEEVTLRLHEAARLLGIQLLDHLVLGHGCYLSLAARGVLPSGSARWATRTAAVG